MRIEACPKSNEQIITKNNRNILDASRIRLDQAKNRRYIFTTYFCRLQNRKQNVTGKRVIAMV